jgi:hypothetical protein
MAVGSPTPADVAFTFQCVHVAANGFSPASLQVGHDCRNFDWRATKYNSDAIMLLGNPVYAPGEFPQRITNAVVMIKHAIP